MPSRAQLKRLASLFGLAVAAACLAQCGAKKKKDADAPPGVAVPAVPSGWDGSSDWSGSAWKVIDE